jgi:hypothetical protein
MAEPGQEKSGSGLEKKLTTKIAGVPAWGVGVFLAVIAIVVYGYIRSRQSDSAAATSATTPADTTTDASVDPNTGIPYADEVDTGSSIDPNTGEPYSSESNFPVGLTAQGTPAPSTNVQWARLALDELIAKGDDPSLVSNALNAYMSGDTLTAAQQGIVNLALTMFGAPPEGVLPVGATPPPTGTGTTPAAPGVPATPSTPSASSITKSSVVLKTNAVPGATLYEWYMNGAPHEHSATPSYKMVGLKSKTTYQFSVAARAGSVIGNTSPVVRVVTL